VCVAGSKQKNSRTTRKTGKRKHDKLEEAADDTQDQGPDIMPAKAKTQKKAPKPRKAKPTGRVGLVNPTAEEMKKAFSMFNSSNRSVIGTQDISRVSNTTQFLVVCLVDLSNGDFMSSDKQSVVMHSVCSEVWSCGMQCLQQICLHICLAKGACMCTNTVCIQLLMCTEQPGVTAAANQARQEKGGSVHTTVLACHAI